MSVDVVRDETKVRMNAGFRKFFKRDMEDAEYCTFLRLAESAGIDPDFNTHDEVCQEVYRKHFSQGAWD